MKKLILLTFLSLSLFFTSLDPALAADKKAAGHEGKALIVFFSHSGNTRRVALALKEKTGATVFEIKTLEKYPTNSRELGALSKKQREEGPLPAIAKGAPSLDGFQYIFIGAPVWGHNLPAPLLTYLSSTDFGGKKVFPFCTMGRNAGDYFEFFKKAAKNATVSSSREFAAVADLTDEELEKEINAWLESLHSK